MLRYDYLPEFIFVRHGETEWNRAGRIQGTTDIELNETGRAQAEEAAQLLANTAISMIITSPLRRALHTAEIINKLHQVDIIQERELQEADFGDEQGVVRQGWAADWRNGTFNPQGAETYRGFSNRVMTGLTCALLEDCKNSDGGITEVVSQGRLQNRMRGAIPLVVAHGGVFWSIVEALGLDTEMNIANALPVHIFQDHQRWHIAPMTEWRAAVGGMM